MRRLLLAGIVLAFPISALSLSFAGPASASVVNGSSGVKCTKIKGAITGSNAKLKGCNDLRNTGGSGKAPIATLATGAGSITWNGTGTTTLANGTFTQLTGSSDTCPIGSDGTQETEYEAVLTVTGGTGAAAKSILAGWTMQAFICIDNGTGALHAAPGTVVNIGPGF